MIKMMIVEDEKILRDGICKVGNWAEHHIEICAVAENGQEALEKMESCVPDIILTDVVMPVMNGIELTKQVRMKFPDIRVILLSGHEEFEYVKKAIEYQAYNYLLKPVRIERLVEVVSEVRDKIVNDRKKLEEEEKLRKKLDQSLPILREHYMNQLLNGRENNEEKIRQQFDFLNIRLSEKNIAVMLCDIDQELGGLEMPRIALLQLRELCQEIIGNEYVCVVFEDLKNRLVIVLNYPQGITTKGMVAYLQGKAVRIQKDFGESGEVSVSIGIGRLANTVRYLSKAYREAEYALSYRFFMGNESVIYIGDVEKEKHMDSFFIAQQEEELLACIKTGDLSGTRKQLYQYFQLLGHYAPEGQDFVFEKITLFVGYLLNSLRDCNMESDAGFLAGMEELSKNLRKRNLFTTLQGIEEQINAVIIDITDRINNNRILRNEGIIEKAGKYIMQNLSGDVSLITVADAVYVSPNYLSFLFKEHGENFKDYVVRVKMERATELMEQGKYNMSQIAQELGYKDGRYFSQAYKKYKNQPN